MASYQPSQQKENNTKVQSKQHVAIYDPMSPKFKGSKGKALIRIFPFESKLIPARVPIPKSNPQSRCIVTYKYTGEFTTSGDMLGIITNKYHDLSTFSIIHALLTTKNISFKPLLKPQTIQLNIPTHIKSEDLLDDFFCIDPPNCEDADDAISVQKCPITNNLIIKTRIAAPGLLYGMNFKDYEWEQFKNQLRTSTLYLPQQTIHLLNSEITECFALNQNKSNQYSIQTEIQIDKDGNFDLIKPPFVVFGRQVKQNFTYDEASKDKYVQNWLIQSIPYIQSLQKTFPIETDIHGLVGISMILTNIVLTRWLINKGYSKKIILRRQKQSNLKLQKTFLKAFANPAEYIQADETAEYTHASLGNFPYGHFTSPLRRFIDLINQSVLGEVLGHYQLPFQDFPIEIEQIDIVHKQISKIHRMLQIKADEEDLSDITQKYGILVKNPNNELQARVICNNTIYSIKKIDQDKIIGKNNGDQVLLKRYSSTKNPLLKYEWRIDEQYE